VLKRENLAERGLAMLKNVNYNLLEETTERSKARYRYDTYLKDAEAAGCTECVELWHNLRGRQEQDLNALMQHFKKHVDTGLVEFGTK
jgi:hypothetical protein